MIKNFIFENFKSFDYATLNLEQLTILIGMNAAGKTNAIEGIKILSEIATGRDLSIILDGSSQTDSEIRGGSKGCCKLNTSTFKLGCVVDVDLQFDLEYLIQIRVANRVFVDAESLYLIGKDRIKKLIFKTTRTANTDSGDIKVQYPNGLKGPNPEILCLKSSACLPQMVSKIPIDSKSYQETIKYIQKVIQNLREILFLNPTPEKMRNYVRLSDTDLRSNAENLAAVLYNINNESSTSFAKILGLIQELPENNITSIDFIKTSIGDVTFRMKEKYGRKEEFIEAKRLSDGTLRCLAVIAALMSIPNGNILIIEEVDNGIHPSRAKSLINAISSIAYEKKVDVIITTHNPALLNEIRGKELLGVTVCYRDVEDGSSKMIPFVDIKRYAALLAQGNLGDLATNNSIKNVLSDTQNQNFDWLEV